MNKFHYVSPVAKTRPGSPPSLIVHFFPAVFVKKEKQSITDVSISLTSQLVGWNVSNDTLPATLDALLIANTDVTKLNDILFVNCGLWGASTTKVMLRP